MMRPSNRSPAELIIQCFFLKVGTYSLLVKMMKDSSVYKMVIGTLCGPKSLIKWKILDLSKLAVVSTPQQSTNKATSTPGVPSTDPNRQHQFVMILCKSHSKKSFKVRIFLPQSTTKEKCGPGQATAYKPMRRNPKSWIPSSYRLCPNSSRRPDTK